MGRISNINRLPGDQQAIVDSCIRQCRYQDLDFILKEVKRLGVPHVSRAGLYRYLVQLKEADSLLADPSQGTIVTIVERSTGEVRVLKTSASAIAIVSMIAKISEPVEFS